MANESSKAFSIDTEVENAEVPTLTSLLYRKKKVSPLSSPAPVVDHKSLEPTKTGTVTATRTQGQNSDNASSVVDLAQAIKPVTSQRSPLDSSGSHQYFRFEPKPSTLEDAKAVVKNIFQTLSPQFKLSGKPVAQTFEELLSNASVDFMCVMSSQILAQGEDRMVPTLAFTATKRTFKGFEAMPNRGRWQAFWKKAAEISSPSLILECPNLGRPDQSTDAFKSGFRKLFGVENTHTLYLLVKTHAEAPTLVAFSLPQTKRLSATELKAAWDQVHAAQSIQKTAA